MRAQCDRGDSGVPAVPVDSQIGGALVIELDADRHHALWNAAAVYASAAFQREFSVPPRYCYLLLTEATSSRPSSWSFSRQASAPAFSAAWAAVVAPGMAITNSS